MAVTMESSVRRFDVRSEDPDVAHDILREAYTDFSVLRAGSAEGFRFSHAGSAAPGITLCRVQYGMAAVMDVDDPRDSFIVATRRAGRFAVTAGGNEVQPAVGEPMLMPTGTGWQVDAADVDVDGTTLDRRLVDRTVREAFGLDPDHVRFSSTTPVSQRAARYWAGVVNHVERDVLAHDEVAKHPLVLSEVARSLAIAMLVTFPNSADAQREHLVQDSGAEPAVLRRALDYIDENADRNISVDDIATAARIGVRGLQSMFRRHRDCTPLDRLRRVRMAHAHTDLQAGDPTRGATVASIAGHWGFSNPGRFSVLYREAYGKSPNETLRT